MTSSETTPSPTATLIEPVFTEPGFLAPAEISGCGCSQGGAAPIGGFVYAIGTIEARFPSLGVEKELIQAARESETARLTDREVLHAVLSRKENRYLARAMCWVLTIEGLETYVLRPRSEAEREQLIEAIRPTGGLDRDVVVGTLGPLAPPQACNGLEVPIVDCDRIYSFPLEEFVGTIPRSQGLEIESFENAARELFERIQQMTDNVGQLDEHRALNYVALRYPAIYGKAVEMYAADASLVGVEVRSSRLSTSRRVVNVIFSYVDRKTDVVERFFTRVDVTEEWPFLVSKLQPFFDR